jgi:hypothetical protein
MARRPDPRVPRTPRCASTGESRQGGLDFKAEHFAARLTWEHRQKDATGATISGGETHAQAIAPLRDAIDS